MTQFYFLLNYKKDIETKKRVGNKRKKNQLGLPRDLKR